MKTIRFLLLVVFVVVAVCIPESVSPASFGSVLASIPAAKKKAKKPSQIPAPTGEAVKTIGQLPKKFQLPKHVRFAAPVDFLAGAPGYYRERGVELYVPLDRYLTASVGAYTLSTNLAPPSDPLAHQHMLMVRFTVPF